MKASRPSATARVIAAATVLSSRDPREAGLVPEASAAWCARLLSTSAADRLLLASVRSAAGRAGWRLAEWLTLPGIIRHYAVRKAFIETLWRSARAEGYSQLVVLGAGLDTLGLRVAQQDDGAHVVELDHPATQSVKRRALRESDAAGLRLVEGRLDQSGWSQTLTASRAVESGRATLAVLEGVSMYLLESEMAALLTELSTLRVCKLRLAFTLFDRPESGPVGFHPASRMVTLWLRLVGEPFRWACRAEALSPFLLSCGFSLVRSVSARELHAAAGTPADRVLQGEGVAIADRLA